MAGPNYAAVAAADARRYNLGPWFVNQIRQESGFNPTARSPAGALGIAQFMPGTARGVGLANPLDPIASLDAAARFDAKLIKQYGSVPRALSAYNSGRPDAYLDPKFAKGQTYNYVRSILGGATGGSAAPAAVPGSGGNAGSFSPDARQRFALGLSQAYAIPNGPGRTAALLQNLLAFKSSLGGASAPSASVPNQTLASSATGLNPNFASELSQLEKAAGVSISSGFRSEATQTALWKQALRKYGSAQVARQWVAPPGHSNHERGLAADLSGNLALAHKLAAKYGLTFPLANEPWHVEPAGLRG